MKSPEFIDLSSKIDGLWVVNLDTYEDLRGFNFEGFNKDKYPEAFKDFRAETPVDSFSTSRYGALRGFHGGGQKLIQLLFGRIQFVLLDTRKDSPTFNKIADFIVTSTRPQQFLAPEGVANAHACLSDWCCFSYKWVGGYVPIEKQFHVHYSRFPGWLISNPILSERDK